MLAGNMKLSTFVVIIGCIGALAVTGGVLYRANNPAPPAPEPVAVAASPAAPAAPAAPATPKATAPAMDEVALSWVGKTVTGGKLKDVSKGHPYKINVYQDEGEPTVNRLKIDLDRDDKWDEKWTFDGPNVSKQVAPADDEEYTESYVWSGGDWIAQ